MAGTEDSSTESLFLTVSLWLVLAIVSALLASFLRNVSEAPRAMNFLAVSGAVVLIFLVGAELTPYRRGSKNHRKQTCCESSK